MITLHKLRLFVVVYEKGSFNQAAETLYMAQSAISQHMHDLETDLGTPLFTRSSRGVQPTPVGDTLYDYARRILLLLGEAERAIIGIAGEETRQLSVAATPGVSVYLLPAWLQQFQKTHPTINVSLQTALTSEVVRDVLDNRYDLGFLEGELLELDQAGLGKMYYGDIDYFVLVNAQDEWATRETISLSELAARPFINRQPNSRTRRWLEATFNQQNVRLRNVAELDSPGAIKYALLNQMGVTILPSYTVEREVERGEIHLLRLAELELKRPLMMVWDKRQPFTPIQRAFIGMLAETATQLQILL